MSGKRGKCPACGQIITVPHKASITPQEPVVSTKAAIPRVPDGPSSFSSNDKPAPAVSQPVKNRTENVLKKDPKESLEHLQKVYRDFAKPVGRSSAAFGCLMVLVIIAGIITCFAVSWLLGIFGGILVLVLVVSIANRVETPHKNRAKERVSGLEKLYGLSHQESLDLLAATRSGAETEDKNEWKTFVTEIWGEEALALAVKQEHTPKPARGATHPAGEMSDSQSAVFRPLADIVFPSACVGCFSANATESLLLNTWAATKTRTATNIGGIGGAFVGAIAGGIVGSIVSNACGETESYNIPICRSCLYRLEKTKIQELADGGGILAPGPTTNLFLNREIKKGCILLHFNNEDYARAFWAQNQGKVFDTLKGCRRGGK
ncbi:hypothetical protein Dole_2602 [Desulfosudis oleivorans Hxd3]|uniref:Uncharacterized protein n=1 Tax=Desulfosudis oleivorans (strain DSM 6200 / JCM 39069 / Hxd3) TaxID=96561 RepID=A8ZWS4_DESOH|nr:hypothetical protein Dole_2602 [Desulfosudis oleivorans Hxd3]